MNGFGIFGLKGVLESCEALFKFRECLQERAFIVEHDLLPELRVAARYAGGIAQSRATELTPDGIFLAEILAKRRGEEVWQMTDGGDGLVVPFGAHDMDARADCFPKCPDFIEGIGRGVLGGGQDAGRALKEV